MKNIARYLLIVLGLEPVLTAQGQLVHSINQNFDVACVLNSNFPSGWMRYNPIAATFPKGAWSCHPDNGKNATPGLQCSGYYDNTFNVDTAYLISPMLNISEYVGKNFFLQFDSKTSNAPDGSKLSIFTSNDDIFTADDPTVDTGIAPVIGTPNDTIWVTRQVDLTSYITNTNFFVGFRYISSAGYGSTWFIDNVKTTTVRLGVADISKDMLPLTVIGQPASDHITLSYSVADAGQYDLKLYDLMGRIIHSETVYAAKGQSRHTINGLNLSAGIYCVKIGNSTGYGVARAIVQ